MICPNCETDLRFGVQMEDWDKHYGSDAMLDTDFPIMITLFCDPCEKPVGMVYIEKVIDEKIVKSKALKDKVHIPLTKSTKRK